MKKLLLLLAAVGMIFTACEGGLGYENNGGTPYTPKIELTEQSVEVEPEPAQYSVSVFSPYYWEATSKNDWIIVDTKTGSPGKKVLKFSVIRNEEEDIREGIIVVRNENYNLVAELYVTQKAFVPTIIIEPESLTFAVEGGSQEIAVAASFEYEFSTNADWLTIKKSEKGLKVTASNHTEVENRTAEITISNEKYGIAKVVTVTQGAFVPEITFSPKSLTFDYKGGTQEVAITANFEHEYSTNADWLTVEKSEKGVNITATPNTKFEECTAEITISSEKYGISKAITITQQGVSAETQNVILYTSSDGKIVTPYKSDSFGANIVSNTYRDGQGIIIFDAPVTSIGKAAFSDCTSLTSVTIPDSVTSIGDLAFSSCYSLTSITIPDSVTSIGKAAFDWCTSLKAFYGKFASSDNRCLIVNGVLNSFAPAGLTHYNILECVTSIGGSAFRHCTSLKSVTIGNSVTSIGYEAFAYCRSLTSVTIPSSVTSIGSDAFNNCTKLTSVTIPDSVTSIGEWAFYECTSLTSVTIPDSVTSIGYYAFGECTLLTSVTIGNSVTSIGEWAFSYCSSLTTITIPDSVTSIGGFAFSDCTSLTSVTIGNSVTEIGMEAFRNCTSLTSITIPDSVTEIGYEAFYDCTSLTRVDVTDLSAWCKISFGGNYANPLCYADKLYLNGSELTDITIPSDIAEIKSYAFYGCTSLKSVTIPDSVTSIGYYAFYDCSSLTSITIGNSVTSIGGWAFAYCRSLTSVTIGDSVTWIGVGAFNNCTSLASVTIPDSVTSIGDHAFYECTSLKYVYCKPITPPTAIADRGYWGAFSGNASGRKIYVPIGSGEAYKTAQYWSGYADYIEEKEF